jgi:ADP-heptose:LPS heptosyltransferase
MANGGRHPVPPTLKRHASSTASRNREMKGRTPQRIVMTLLAAWESARLARGRAYPRDSQRILVAHHLRLGDVFMLTPLLAKLREQYPRAEILMTAPSGSAELYRHHPFGVRALPYASDRIGSLLELRRVRGFDLAIVPGNNWYTWLARALGAQWIVAFAGDRPAHKSWPADQLIDFPGTPTAWGDMNTLLIPGPAPRTYRAADWPAPAHPHYEAPQEPYCVLHPGASRPLKQWPDGRWRALSKHLREKGLDVVWTGTASEQRLIERINPNGAVSYAGKLSLTQLWHLLEHAQLLVSVDTSVAHLGRITGTPTVALFGPGSALIAGAGEYWRDSPFWAVTVVDVPCRDQRTLFKREMSWIRHCMRSPRECANNICMQRIDTAQVTDAVEQALRGGRARRAEFITPP